MLINPSTPHAWLYMAATVQAEFMHSLSQMGQYRRVSVAMV